MSAIPGFRKPEACGIVSALSVRGQNRQQPASPGVLFFRVNGFLKFLNGGHPVRHQEFSL